MLAAYGYRYGEVPLKEIAPIKKGTKITIHREVDLSKRPVVAASLGCHVPGVLMPHPDPHDTLTTVAGVGSRFTFAPPTPDPTWLEEFRVFVQTWLQQNMTPLSADTDVSFDWWIEQTHYSQARKQELREKWEKLSNIRDPSKKYHWCKSFQKDEHYPAYKHSRAINSRSDEFKCFSGPFFKRIEEELYKLPQFIKHIPVADRPAYIRNYLRQAVGEDCQATDFTAFESLFTETLMEVCEMQLYQYMTGQHPMGPDWFEVVHDFLVGENVCQFKNFTTRVPATRMSGDMCTSLGNGFTNLMVFLFIVHKIGGWDPRIVVEGDDGLGNNAGPKPTSEHFTKLGLVVKLERHTDISTASFCGIIFDPEDMINVADPRECVAQIGWCSRQYALAKPSKRKALLRCKALSYAHQYPGCPIIQSCALWLLRATRGHEQAARDIVGKQKYVNMWYKNKMMAAFRDEKKLVPKTPGNGTRFLVERKYGITVEQQKEIEAYFDGLDHIQPINIPCLNWSFPNEWKEYYANYVINVGKGDRIDYPALNWNPTANHVFGR